MLLLTSGFIKKWSPPPRILTATPNVVEVVRSRYILFVSHQTSWKWQGHTHRQTDGHLDIFRRPICSAGCLKKETTLCECKRMFVAVIRSRFILFQRPLTMQLCKGRLYISRCLCVCESVHVTWIEFREVWWETKRINLLQTTSTTISAAEAILGGGDYF